MAGRTPATRRAGGTTHSKRGGDPGLADIGVVYLYRFAEGELAARAFLDNYRAHPAGVDHDLHVIFKGFPDSRALTSAQAIFAGLPINTIELDDTGFDVGSYLAAAKRVSNRRLIFFNTFSELLADDWLKKFDSALSSPDVGLVGATGSWQSLSSYYEVLINRAWHELGHLFGYRKRPATNGEETPDVQDAPNIDASDTSEFDERTNAARKARALYRLVRLDHYLMHLYQYGRFPNPHVRTNAFMIERDRFLSLGALQLNTKRDLYNFESGRRSMTRQIMAQGLKPVVIGRNGEIYHIPDWKSSSTFWIGQQNNLLAADNRTRDYDKANQARRAFLEDNAWTYPSDWAIARGRYSTTK
jgi:hypothetical protein